MHRKTKTLNLLFITLVALSVLVPMIGFAGADAAVPAKDYSETFETDTNNANPSDTWYTYSEYEWDTANVDGSLGRGASSKSFRVNDTNGLNAVSNFTVSADSYNYYETWFLYDNTSHDITTVSVYSGTTELAKFIVNSTVNDSTNDFCLFQNNTAGKGFNETLSNNSWYKIKFTFNYTTNYIYGQIFNSTGSTLNNSWLPVYDGSTSYSSISCVKIKGTSSAGAYIWFDDMALYKSGTAATGFHANTNYLTEIVVPLLVAIVVIVTISSMVLTTGVTKETMIAAMMAAIIGAIVISVVSGL